MVLLGAGHAHVHVLKHFAQHQPLNTRITLVSPYTRQIYSGMIPGWIAGHYALDECTIDVTALIAGSAIVFHQAALVSMNAGNRSVTLSDGTTLHFDSLSINSGGTMNPAVLTGAAEFAVCVRPLEAFVQQFEAAIHKNPQSIAVIGGGAAGAELALAIKHRTSHASVSLIAGAALLPSHAQSVQRAIAKALKNAQIDTLIEPAACVLPDQTIQLASGAMIDSALTLLALGVAPALWVAHSGLALCPRGFIATSATLQCVSHAHVFAVGDAASCISHSAPKSGVYAVRAAAPLLANLLAWLASKPLQPVKPKPRSLSLIACGDRRAIASWGGWTVQGAWVWRWKNWLDRRFIQKYRR